MIEINLNQTVRVKLTQRGRAHYRAMMTALNQRLPDTAEPLSTEPQLDSDGYYRSELWRVMQDFGTAFSMSLTPPFEMTVMIEP